MGRERGTGEREEWGCCGQRLNKALCWAGSTAAHLAPLDARLPSELLESLGAPKTLVVFSCLQ